MLRPPSAAYGALAETMKRSPAHLGTLFAFGFVVVGLLLGYQIFARHNIDALLFLGSLAMPLSHLGDELLHGLARIGMLPSPPIMPLQYATLLVAGVLQYFSVGFLVAFAWRSFARWLQKRRHPRWRECVDAIESSLLARGVVFFSVSGSVQRTIVHSRVTSPTK